VTFDRDRGVVKRHGFPVLRLDELPSFAMEADVVVSPHLNEFRTGLALFTSTNIYGK
jgi:hypothetical protein